MFNSSDIKEVLLTEEEIKKIVKRLGEQITKDYEGKNLLVVSILKGSVMIMADLLREIKLDCKIDFMAVSSYGSGTRTSGSVKIIKDLSIDLSGYDILLVEDILDSGVTLSNLKELLMLRKPASLKICAFLDKPERRKADIVADYTGASIPDEFVVGYGLDYDEKYRNLPYVGILSPSVYGEN
ncbi:MAG: hypoxanthine phosphoribosyltransferase [Clostridia bacterium]|nr:hypoxanthine phosphoribosyltransferase [Clostridia bacterium]MBQ9977703.1 hypoxanthine phosphoribosyltransferase [Clostridia bacterium]